MVTIVVIADQVPMALPLSLGLKAVEINDKLPGIIRAPPIPCNARKIISNKTVGAKPQAREPMIKISIPIMKIFFLPSLSPSEPPIKMKEASINR